MCRQYSVRRAGGVFGPPAYGSHSSVEVLM